VVGFILWLTVVVGISVAALLLKAVSGASTWSHTLRQGDLLLVGIGLTASAIAYTAAVPGGITRAKAAVIGPGLLFLFIAAVVYALVGDNPSSSRLSPGAISVLSYVFFGVSMIFGCSSTYLTYRREPTSATLQ
jgi:hypothetical protein